MAVKLAGLPPTLAGALGVCRRNPSFGTLKPADVPERCSSGTTTAFGRGTGVARADDWAFVGHGAGIDATAGDLPAGVAECAEIRRIRLVGYSTMEDNVAEDKDSFNESARLSTLLPVAGRSNIDSSISTSGAFPTTTTGRSPVDASDQALGS